ncbi:MAG: radical SAM protein [Nanoarchaeota archaeon]|nr:radical SAM protein [Nanoarchaeota archaeon]MBU1622359.1 radical SAM protein [Nanoarchaeota archaeon]
MVTVFILDSRCNLNCQFCLCQGEKALKTKDVKEKLAEVTGTVIFTGGEPLLRADLNELCKSAKENNLIVGVHTNAILFDKLNLDYVDFVNLPLDGPENVHNQLRKDNYNFVIKALNKLEERGIKVRITTIATKVNLDEIKNIPPILSQYSNIILWRIFKYKDNGRANHLTISAQEFATLKEIKADCKTEFIDDIDNFSKWEKVAN